MASDRPLLVERPQRGREMVTKELNLPDQGPTATRMHEGFVGGQKYLVPDTDLLAMKELVDYKLGKGPQDRYIRDYDYGQPPVDEDQRFKKMSRKLESVDEEEPRLSAESRSDEKPRKRTLRFEDTISLDAPTDDDTDKDKNKDKDKETDTDTEADTDTDADKGKKGEDEKDDDDEEEDEESEEVSTSEVTDSASSSANKVVPPSTSEHTDSLSSSAKKVVPPSTSEHADSSSSSAKKVVPPSTQRASLSSERPSKRYTMPFDVENADKLRFLLSGHIRENQKPMFIFHQYNGKSPFDGRPPDFYSDKKDGDTDLRIKGAFFQESILEENNNVPLSLRLKPDKIVIDNRSKIYDESFFELIHLGQNGIEMEGRFIIQKNTLRLTPFLSFNVIAPSLETSKSKNYEPSRDPHMVYIAKPTMKNIFEYKNNKQSKVEVNKKDNKRDVALRQLEKPLKSPSPTRSQKKRQEVHDGEQRQKRKTSKSPSPTRNRRPNKEMNKDETKPLDQIQRPSSQTMSPSRNARHSSEMNKQENDEYEPRLKKNPSKLSSPSRSHRPSVGMYKHEIDEYEPRLKKNPSKLSSPSRSQRPSVDMYKQEIEEYEPRLKKNPTNFSSPSRSQRPSVDTYKHEIDEYEPRLKKNPSKLSSPSRSQRPSFDMSEDVLNKSDSYLKRNSMRISTSSRTQRPKSAMDTEEVYEYEPHLRRSSSKPPQKRQSRRLSSDVPQPARLYAGDVGSQRGIAYNCDVNRPQSSGRSQSILQRLSQMFFP